MDSEFKRMALTRKEAVKQWDTKLSRMNDSVEAYISECSVVLIPFLENAHFNDEFNGSCPDISIEDALLHINKKLDVLLSLESKLKHARAALQSYRNTSFTLAPINRLPVEILSYIVETGREQEEQEEREWKARFREEGYMGEAESWDANILNPEEVPQDLIEYIKKAQNKIRFDVLFSWVCNKWRCIAISITALWSKIDFRGRPPYDCAQEYIRRSKPSSLSVYFNSQRHKSSLSESQNMDKALELISNNVDRVKTLVVEVTSTSEIVKV
ncbi:hypothetical protein FRC02_008075 [Tulasnella sp. 418]|nr:hypothetical protein FRC02_008075 [Tulasnella sp. 418]